MDEGAPILSGPNPSLRRAKRLTTNVPIGSEPFFPSPTLRKLLPRWAFYLRMSNSLSQTPYSELTSSERCTCNAVLITHYSSPTYKRYFPNLKLTTQVKRKSPLHIVSH